MAAGFMNVLVASEAFKQIDLKSILIGENCKTLFGLSDQGYREVYGGPANVCRREHQIALTENDLVKNADTVILASYWWEGHIIRQLPATAKYLKEVSGAKIYVLGMNVQMNDGIWFLSKNAFSPKKAQLRTHLHPKTAIVNKKIKRNAIEYGYFDLVDAFCDEEGCQRITKEGYPVIFDDSHFSEKGARLLGLKIKDKDWFRNLKRFKGER